jgi:hypothetical protein
MNCKNSREVFYCFVFWLEEALIETTKALAIGYNKNIGVNP